MPLMISGKCGSPACAVRRWRAGSPGWRWLRGASTKMKVVCAAVAHGGQGALVLVLGVLDGGGRADAGLPAARAGGVDRLAPLGRQLQQADGVAGGAVSKITTSKAVPFIGRQVQEIGEAVKGGHFGGAGPLICSSITCTIWGGKAARMGAMARSIYSWVALSGSISMAHRFGTPAIGVTWWPIACSNTSARLEAGSVVTISVRLPSSA